MPCPNAATKTVAVIAGMLAGADSIDDLDVLRHGGMTRVCTGIRAPSTLGTFLRSFTHGHVQQVDAAAVSTLAGLTATVPTLLAGADGLALVDVDDTIREVHGYAKQGAAFGYTKVRGLNIALATLSTPIAAPVIAAARLRSGNTASATGVRRLLAHAIGTARAAGASGQVLARADSAYYGWAFVGTAIRHKAWFSVTARMTPAVATAIAAIPDTAWQPIHYPNAIEETDPQTGEVNAVNGVWATSASETKASCSPPTATTPSSPTADWLPCRPTPTTAATRSSSRPSPNSRTGHWPTCPPVPTPPTPPGWPAPSSRSTWPAPPPSLPACTCCAGPACAPNSSTSRPASPPADGDRSCTYPPDGPGNRPGKNLWTTATGPPRPTSP